MKIDLICVGKKMPKWIETGIEHYQKQLPKSLNFSLTPIEAQNRKHSDIETIKKTEGEMLLKASKESTVLIAFDETGKQHSTQDVANRVKKWQQNGERVSLFIGGADGLSEEIKHHANELWGLSKLTLPHSMARLLAVEQIYRAYTLINNHPYHRQ